MTTPIPAEDLPKASAEAMNWTSATNPHTRADFWLYPYAKGCVKKEDWKPHLSHDHVQLCVEECFKRGVIQEYYKALMVLIRKRYGFDGEPILVLLATPEEQAVAALAALTGK